MPTQIIIADQFQKIVTPLIDEAKKQIDIIVFDWRWYPTDIGSPCQLFNAAIIRAARRGVQVRVVTSCLDIVNLLKDNGIQAKKLRSSKLLHCKYMAIDDRIVITGSHNYTQSAFSINFEMSVALTDIENIADFSNFFQSIWLS